MRNWHSTSVVEEDVDWILSLTSEMTFITRRAQVPLCTFWQGKISLWAAKQSSVGCHVFHPVTTSLGNQWKLRGKLHTTGGTALKKRIPIEGKKLL